MGSLNFSAMQKIIFDFVQWRFEVARRDWAEWGGRWKGFSLTFWSWLYGLQKVPGAEK